MVIPLSVGAQQLWSEGSEFGAELQAGGTNNTEGSYVEIASSVPYESQGFQLSFARSGNGLARDFLVDIAIGAAASEQIIVPDILVSFDGNNVAWSVYIPVALPQGVRISGRCQGTDNDSTLGVRFRAYSGTHHLVQGLPTGGVNYGGDATDSGGVSVDPGGVGSTKGSYSEITSATSREHKGLLVSFGNQNNAIAATRDFTCDIAIGASSSEQIIIPDIGGGSNASDTLTPGQHFFPVRIPAGTRLAARGRTNTTDATDRLFDVVIIGF